MWRISFILVLCALSGCIQNPDEQPKMADLVGTWIPASSSSISSTQFMRLSADHTFFATNFPSQSMSGQATPLSGGGTWSLEPNDAAWIIDLTYTNPAYRDKWTIRHRKPPYLLTAPLEEAEDEGIQAHRVEDLSR
jgi:hypothetical protein